MGENGANRLLGFVLAVEAQEAVKREAGIAQREIMTEAKKAGFNPKMIRQMISERLLDEVAREEWHAQAQIYRAALGMLGDTPLGEAAQRRLLPPEPPEPPEQTGEGKGKKPKAKPPAPTGPSEGEISGAHEAGIAAARAGEKVTANPYLFGDPRRVAWDSGWCSASASDGMDIPEAFRRPKKPDDASAGAAQ